MAVADGAVSVGETRRRHRPRPPVRPLCPTGGQWGLNTHGGATRPVALVPAEECGRKPRSWSAETAVAWPGPPRIGMRTEVFDVRGGC